MHTPDRSDFQSAQFYTSPGMLIDGQLVDGALSLDVVNPATGAVFARCPRADEAQFEAAVQAAAAAQPLWAAQSEDDRASRLTAFADAIEARKGEFATLLTREQGKPYPEALAEIGGAVGLLRYHSTQRLPFTVIQDNATRMVAEQRVPLGVVAAIAPWNFPVSLLMGKIAPALLAGNTVVAKPASTTPLSTLLLGEVAKDILPAGTLNIVIDANDLGGYLTAHPQIAKVSFTGSTATGKRVMASSAGTLKRLTLELGGNDAAIILDDADIQAIAPRLFRAAMINAGQVCMAIKRVYAHNSRYDELCDTLANLARAAVVGAGDQPDTQIGPLQNRQQYDLVVSLLDSAARDGTVIAGGAALDREGFFVAPTVVRDLANDARLVREEQFGPIIPVIRYENEDDVVDMVNDSEFGLAASVWTGNAIRGVELAKRVTSGTVWVNTHLDLPPDISFGGAKQSGIGRERGQAGLEEFTQLKIINVAK
nr:aldehyde dehydrogenase family protein [Sphingomonas sp. CDS-1]